MRCTPFSRESSSFFFSRHDQDNWLKVQINVFSDTNKMCLCAYETQMTLVVTKYKSAISSIKVTIKVTWSLTLVWFKRVSLVEYILYPWQILCLYLLPVGKLWWSFKFFLPKTDTHRIKGQKLDAPELNCVKPLSHCHDFGLRVVASYNSK